MSNERSEQATQQYRQAYGRLSAFPYPGGKTPYVDDILRHFPTHRRYVEPFGGSASILLNKPESYVEVYNDRDGDVVHFFRTVRERPEDLVEWLETIPFARATYEKFQGAFSAGYRPDDDIERAGRWFALRYMNYGGNPDRRAGFKRSNKRNEARSFRGGTQALRAVVDRFSEVTIECADYREILDRYDDPETLIYLDPPYVDVGDRYYSGPDFDHAALADALRDRSAKWICSYGELPDGLADIATTVTSYGASYSLEHTRDTGRKEATERLAMNFDPSTTPTFVDRETEQRTLQEVR